MKSVVSKAAYQCGILCFLFLLQFNNSGAAEVASSSAEPAHNLGASGDLNTAGSINSSANSNVDVADVNPEEDGEFSVFDFYVGGRYYGLAYGYFADDWVAFDLPEDILEIEYVQ